MNQFDEPQKGRPRNFSSEQAHELEAALRSLRPRAPEFDMDCLWENANEADDRCSPVVTVDVSDSVDQIDTSSLQSSWLTVAGAWACGALVGGLAVFGLMQNRIATLQSFAKKPPRESGVVSIQQAETVETGPRENEEPHTNSTEKSTPEYMVGAAAHATTFNDPQGHAWSAIFGEGTSALTAGSHLRLFGDRPAMADGDVAPVPFSSNRVTEEEFELNVGDSRPPVTRAWLLEELLSTSPRTL